MSRERFVLPEECDFDHLYAQRKQPDIGERINKALAGIEDANKSKLEGVFRNIDFNNESNLGETKERNVRLVHLLEDFNDERLDLRPSKVGQRDVIGDVYEYLIGNFASDAGKKGGEFYTPAEVSRLLATIVAPKAGDRICDPCCGSGSLLIRAGRAVGSDDFALFGQELNASTWALARMNMFLHGLDNARIERGDTIRNPKLVEDDRLMKFNVVVANPPFSLDKWGADTAEHDTYKRFWRGTPPKSRGDYAFISHMVETMNESDGRVGVVVPHGVLFRGGSEGLIRQRFIEENLLEGVIGLPANLFFGVGIPAALLFFRRDKKDKNVFFIDASREYAEGKNQNKLRDEDLAEDRRHLARAAGRAEVRAPRHALRSSRRTSTTSTFRCTSTPSRKKPPSTSTPSKPKSRRSSPNSPPPARNSPPPFTSSVREHGWDSDWMAQGFVIPNRDGERLHAEIAHRESGQLRTRSPCQYWDRGHNVDPAN